MKQILYSIMMCCLMVTFLTACSQENDPFPQGEGTKGNGITLKLSTGIQFQTRAEAAGAEVAVSHLDVFIFDANETMRHYERVSNCTNERGTVTLAASKDDFDANTGYYVYLLANSTHATDDFKNLASLSALKAMTQEDERIHITGLSNVAVAPKTFLMDGIAYSGEQEPQAATQVVLNDGNPSSDTELKVMLRRAAAKIIIHVNNGDAVTFDKEQENATPDYYLRNMPYSTSLLAGVDGEAKLRTSMKSNTSYYEWNEDGTITLTAYTYAHKWADASAFEKEVRLVVNIPLKYTMDGQETASYPASYYQIPVCKDKVLERNTCYEVTVTVSAPGGTDPSAPVELSGIEYTVTDWTEKIVGIGGDDEHPIYLYVNEEEMEMHNITDDNTTLEFASSSAVSATVTSVYYYDKFGQKKTEALTTVTVTPDSDLNGHIKIHSPLPTNNTIRYIEMTVTNTDNATPKTVTIAQYPLEYITNIQGWYSYRDDFGTLDTYNNPTETSYEKLNGLDMTDWESTSKITQRYCGSSWSNSEWTYTNNPSNNTFFGSKVAIEKTDGTSTIRYYSWREDTRTEGNWWNQTTYYSYDVRNGSSITGLDNARMYHVRITASSGDYTIGKPRITDGKTDPGADNAQLVSPSFMIASQLGAVLAAENVNVAASHCEQYVEVYKDPQNQKTIHLKDWRLPTEAELKIIMKFQDTSDAMDVVLSGDRYWSASGLVVTDEDDRNPSDKAIRCIRDAYETE